MTPAAHKKDSLDIAEYLFAISLIIQGASVWNTSIRPQYPLLPIATVCCIWLWFVSKRNNHKKLSLNKLSVVILCLSSTYGALSFGIGNLNYTLGMFIIGLPLMIDYFITCSQTERKYELFYKIENCIYVLSVISIILWLIGPIGNFIDPNCVVANCAWGGPRDYKGYFYLLFEAQHEDGTFFSNSSLWRNSSIFAETPMYNFWLMNAIGIECFLRDKISKKRISVLLLAILTTFSTTGFLFIIICVLLNMYSKVLYSTSKVMNFLKYPLFITAVIGGYLIVQKILLLKSTTASFETRLGDYEAALFYLQNISLIGTGYGDDSAMVTALNTQGFSNGIFAVLVSGGFFLGIIILFPLIANMIRGLLLKKTIMLSFSVLQIYILSTVLCQGFYFLAVSTGLFWASLFVMSKKKDLL